MILLKILNAFIFDYHLRQAARAVLQNQQQITMDVMTAVSSHSCLTDMGDLPHQTTPNLVNQRDDSLDSATYLGSVGVSESEPGTGVDTVTTTPYLQYV